ncbi:T9SS type A sorting domain-containing protein [Longitalea luteola]|uniref:T9SS type A sorting domain-containing protein n=1 Tax=Longitalea luteola TaxID=2812563 RepID=UPI001A969710|nr:T9SS type A sorting domain-containing protein [Longitalea luteola]
MNNSNENTTIALFAIDGARVFEANTTGMRYIIDPTFLKTGTYLVRVKNATTDQTRKLIVQ